MTLWRSIKKAVERLAHQQALFHIAGNAAVATRVGPAFKFVDDVLIDRVQILAKTAPVGAAILANVKDGASTAIAATLADGATSQLVVPTNPYKLAAGNVMTLDVTQVGSGTPGADVTYLVTYIRSVF